MTAQNVMSKSQANFNVPNRVVTALPPSKAVPVAPRASQIGLSPAAGVSRRSQNGSVSASESGSEAASQCTKLYKTVFNADGTVQLVEVSQEYKNALLSEEKYVGYSAITLSILTFFIAVLSALSVVTYFEEWDFK
ncbi:hypothetical protein L596_020028 [Steinernema carpocapsae]|uniref:Uncharacterized protein n=1 Tax=Steinernema carpocapsae TaxID=34508 RepID=A0A4U5MSC0_STECR|nr:hypothetical protein L596_020028 [Steinernema carpocapsae]